MVLLSEVVERHHVSRQRESHQIRHEKFPTRIERWTQSPVPMSADQLSC
jgi:hypothetical protein